MSAPKLTPWFPPEVKPVRDGVYQIKTPFEEDRIYANWYNGLWHGYAESHEEPERFVTMNQQRHWRGLTTPAGKRGRR